VVVSTATIALQRQLVDRDLPRLVDAVAAGLPRRLSRCSRAGGITCA
jgi:ATP-dependent DNA helicase DinG